jgi:hypothetical protein
MTEPPAAVIVSSAGGACRPNIAAADRMPVGHNGTHAVGSRYGVKSSARTQKGSHRERNVYTAARITVFLPPLSHSLYSSAESEGAQPGKCATHRRGNAKVRAVGRSPV